MSTQPMEDPQASNGAPRLGHAIDTGELAPEVHHAAVQARLEQLEAVVRRAKFIRDSPAPYSVSRAAEQAAVAESARKILGPLAGEQ